MRTMEDPTQLFGNDVQDSAGSSIGTVDGVWIDDATDALEFIGVKTGWLMGKNHLIPVINAQVSDGTITVPYTESQIKDAPSFGADAELTPDDEDEIYTYYEIDRSTGTSPTGLPATGADVGGDTARVEETVDTGPDAVRGDSDRIRLHEEELQVGTRQVEAGRVRLRKVIRTEHQEVPVELRREEIEIERLPASGNDLGDAAFQEQEINVSAMREEPVVGKQVRAKEDVRLTKTVETGTESVGADVRREDVTVDTDRSDLLDDSSRT